MWLAPPCAAHTRLTLHRRPLPVLKRKHFQGSNGVTTEQLLGFSAVTPIIPLHPLLCAAAQHHYVFRSLRAPPSDRSHPKKGVAGPAANILEPQVRPRAVQGKCPGACPLPTYSRFHEELPRFPRGFWVLRVPWDVLAGTPPHA